MLSLDHLLERVDGGVFSLIRVAMKRAVEVHGGAPSLIEHPLSDKSTTVALKEIAHGKIVIDHKKTKKLRDAQIKLESGV